MLKYSCLILLFSVSLLSCRKEPNAEAIVKKAIKEHGGHLLEKASISFEFRDVPYAIHRDQGLFTYERFISDSAGVFHDILNNDFFVRELDGQHYRLSTADSIKYANGINAVVYFALLPYFLKDDAVVKRFDGIAEIKGKTYYKIRVGFNEEGGGKDHEDEYMYWFDTETYRMDYLAYRFFTEDGGVRFRTVLNRKEINGVIFQDYINYSHPDKTVELADLPDYLENGALKEVSRVVLDDIKVRFN